MRKRKSDDGLDVYICKWQHFDILKFLDDFIAAKQSTVFPRSDAHLRIVAPFK